MKRIILFLMIGFLMAQNPLVELSRKEKKRREKIKASRVITNDDLKGLPPALSASAKSSSAVSNIPSGEKPASSKKKDEQWWRQQSKAIRDKIAKLEEEIKKLQLKVNSLSMRFLIEQRPFEHQKVKEELEKAKGDLLRAKKELEKAKQELEALYEKARKEGIPPGWIR